MIKKILKRRTVILITIAAVIFISVLSIAFFLYYQKNGQRLSLVNSQKDKLTKTLSFVKKDLDVLKSEDQYKINKDLEDKIAKIEATYKKAVTAYERLLDLKIVTKKTDKFDSGFADILTLLSERNYASAESELNQLTKDIASERQTILASFIIPVNAPESNAPPQSGFSQQVVKTDVGDFLVDIVSADLSSTRVVVDTASDSDCRNDCPVLSLGDYVSRSGAYAGINGSYFCPADYPSCSDKKNSYDTLVMNKDKKYINSDNNVYSTVPAAIFMGGSVRFVGQSLEWGRDTSVDGVIAMQPLLVSNGAVAFNGDGEPKRGSKGSRSFVGASGSAVYIGVVFNATVAEAAHVVQALGIQNALNLDDGGSTALWSGGYKAGPGRNLPNVVLFLRK